jgi:hypothetical protein
MAHRKILRLLSTAVVRMSFVSMQLFPATAAAQAAASGRAANQTSS